MPEDSISPAPAHEWRASQMGFISQCPGRWKSTRDLADKPGAAALRGTRIHAALAAHIALAHEPDDLREGDAETYESCVRYATPLCESAEEIHAECRLSLTQQIGGTADVVFVRKEDIVVVDWKCGRGDLHEEAVRFQLSIYIAAALERFQRPRGKGIAYQPGTGVEISIELCLDDVESVREACQLVIAAATSDEMVLRPTADGCRYCPARDHCPAAAATISDLSAAPAATLALWDHLPPEKKATLIEKAKVVELLAKEIYSRARADLSHDALAIPGWRARARTTHALVREIGDVTDDR